MQLVQALLGAVIGAGIGAGIMVGVEQAGYEFGWFVIVIGLITGIVTRLISSGSGGMKYVRGALAALATLAAFILGKYAVAHIVTGEMTTPSKPAATAAAEPATPTDDDQEPEETAQQADEQAPEEEVVIPPTPPATAPVANVPGAVRKPAEFEPLDMIFLAIGALVAYEIARGGDKKNAPAESATSDKDSPAPGDENV